VQRDHLQIEVSRQHGLDNLVLPCHRHDWSVHEGGWQVVRTEYREVLATRPSTPTGRAPERLMWSRRARNLI
jgi:hypothetical protein